MHIPYYRPTLPHKVLPDLTLSYQKSPYGEGRKYWHRNARNFIIIMSWIVRYVVETYLSASDINKLCKWIQTSLYSGRQRKRTQRYYCARK